VTHGTLILSSGWAIPGRPTGMTDGHPTDRVDLLTRWTRPMLTPRSAAITRTPRRPGTARAVRILRSTSSLARGLPSRRPSARILASPARILSWIMARSNSAKTPIIWNMALPAGVVVSRPCWYRNRSIPAECTSDRNPVLQRPAQAVHGPGHDHVESGAGRVHQQSVEAGPAVTGPGAGDPVVPIDPDDLVAHPGGDLEELPLLVVGRLLGRADPEIESGAAHLFSTQAITKRQAVGVRRRLVGPGLACCLLVT
jgi:hypothetical protein